jgi:hypothetical protein
MAGPLDAAGDGDAPTAGGTGERVGDATAPGSDRSDTSDGNAQPPASTRATATRLVHAEDREREGCVLVMGYLTGIDEEW